MTINENKSNKAASPLIWIDPLHTPHFQKLVLALLTCFVRCGLMESIPEKDISLIARLARNHDIGKLWIPPSILYKPEKLTLEEERVMRTHPTMGAAMVAARFPTWKHTTAYQYFYEICLHHHERWDGNGYPDGLIGDETPRYVQVIAIADALDALMARRSYRPALTTTQAMSMVLQGECGTFSPALIKILHEELDAIMYEIYPATDEDAYPLAEGMN